MAYIGIIIDVILFAILFFCAFKGWKKGLILSVSGILAVIIAIWGSNLVADAYSEMFTPALRPFVSGQVDKAVDAAQESYDETPSGNEVFTVAEDALHQVGFLSTAANNLAQELSDKLSDTGYRLKNMMVDSITKTLARALVMTVAFILIVIVFTVISNIVNLAFKLPGLRLVNDIGGAVCGLLKGVLLVFALSWVVRFLGFFLPEQVMDHNIVDRTLLLKFFININPLSGIFGV